MEYKIEHIGYMTGSIENTASAFKSIGYKWGGEFILMTDSNAE